MNYREKKAKARGVMIHGSNKIVFERIRKTYENKNLFPRGRRK